MAGAGDAPGSRFPSPVLGRKPTGRGLYHSRRALRWEWHKEVYPSSRIHVPLHNTPLYVVPHAALRSLFPTSDNGLYVNQAWQDEVCS
jgi:hypothetical protein